jgi:hypothetical protein
MRARPLSRLATTLIGLLYLLAWGEPAAWHPCPMHDGVALHATAGATVATGPAAHAHAGHAAMASASDAAPASDEAEHGCDCLGHGCCAAGVPSPTAQAVRWRVLVARRAEPEAPAPAVLTRAAAPRRLPYANGPPGLA